MKSRISDKLKYAILLGAAFGLMFFVQAGVFAADDDADAGTEYVNPFWEENQELYQEAMILQGYLMPGVAYTDESADDAQARHYNPLPDNIVLGDSEVTTRYKGGAELGFTADYIDNNNAGVGVRYNTSDYQFKGGFNLSDFASIENTPADVRTTWTDNQVYGFEVVTGNLFAGWNHKDTNRDWEFTGLDEYESDRVEFTYGTPFASGDLDLGLVFTNIESSDLDFNGRSAIMASANGRFPMENKVDLRVGYGGAWAQKPGGIEGGRFSKHALSASIGKRDFYADGFDLALFGNYETLGDEQTLNTHYDRKYNWGGKAIYNPSRCVWFEGGAWAEYFDVDYLRWEMPELGEYMLMPGLTADDLERFTVRNYGHAYNSYLKGRVKFANGGAVTQEFRYGRHYDNQAPDGAADSGIDAQQPLTLYTRWDWKTDINAPLSDDVSWQLTNFYRRWDMRLREDDGRSNTLATSLNWNPCDNTGLSFHYENLTGSFGIDDIDRYAANQHGFGVDGWYKANDDLSYNGGIFWGKGNGEFNSFDRFGIYYSIVMGSDGRWKLKFEYNKSDADDFDALDFDVFDAVLYYKIDV